MSLKNRLRRLEAVSPDRHDCCQECGTPRSEVFPIAFGDVPMCATCGTLMLPDDARKLFPALRALA